MESLNAFPGPQVHVVECTGFDLHKGLVCTRNQSFKLFQKDCVQSAVFSNNGRFQGFSSLLVACGTNRGEKMKKHRECDEYRDVRWK